MTRPSRPNVDPEAICAAPGTVLDVCRVRSATAVEASTRDDTAPDAAMITIDVGECAGRAEITEDSSSPIYCSGAGQKHPY